MTSRILQIHQVGVKSVFFWLGHAWRLFQKNPIVWLSIIGVYSVIAMMTVSIPFLGIIFPIINPILMAGMILGCAALDREKPLKFGYLYAGFLHKSASKLATIGGLYSVVFFLLMIFLSLSGQEQLLNSPLLATGSVDSDMKNMSQNEVSSPVGILFFLFMIFLNMAYWFAPILTCFFNIRAKDALFLSFRACLKNIVPFVVFSFVLFMIALVFVIIMVSIFPIDMAVKMMLLIGSPLFILICMLSIYTSYRSIFTEILVEKAEESQ